MITVRDRDDLHDPQDAPIIGYCKHCGQEIYAGEPCFIQAEYDGRVHEECMMDWLYETYVSQLAVRCAG